MKLTTTKRLGTILGVIVLAAACSPARDHGARDRHGRRLRPRQRRAIRGGLPVRAGVAVRRADRRRQHAVAHGRVRCDRHHPQARRRAVRRAAQRSGGLLGRPVEWTLLDDESDGAKVTTLYEQLISQDGVDLIIGPVWHAEHPARHGGGRAARVRHAAAHGGHRPAAAPTTASSRRGRSARRPTSTSRASARRARELPDAAEDDRDRRQPERLHRLRRQRRRRRPTTGVVKVAEERGLDGRRSTSATRRRPRDWAPIATQIRDANPDFVFNSGHRRRPGEPVQAMAQLDYQPPMMFSLFPAPGPAARPGRAGRGRPVGLASSRRTTRPSTSSVRRPRRSSRTFEARRPREAAVHRLRDAGRGLAGTPGRSSSPGVKGAGNARPPGDLRRPARHGRRDHVQRQAHVRPGQQQLLADRPRPLKQIQNGDWVDGLADRPGRRRPAS